MNRIVLALTPWLLLFGVGALAQQMTVINNPGILSTLAVSGAIINSGIASDATHTDAAVCEDTTSHQFYFGSGTAGICLGTSSARYKRDIVEQTDGLAQIMALAPKNYFYLKGYGDDGAREQYGLVAEDVVKVLPKLVGLDADGRPNSVDLLGMVPILIKAVQELKAENEALRGVRRADVQ